MSFVNLLILDYCILVKISDKKDTTSKISTAATATATITTTNPTITLDTSYSSMSQNFN